MGGITLCFSSVAHIGWTGCVCGSYGLMVAPELAGPHPCQGLGPRQMMAGRGGPVPLPFLLIPTPAPD